MKTSRSIFSSFAVAALCASTGFVSTAYGWVVDPQKVKVDVGQSAQADHDFTLAYDTNNKSIVYYMPKGGRVALMNGMPMLGFAVLDSGFGVLNAQFEFGVFGTEKEQLFNAIRAAGYTPTPMVYRGTKIKPYTPGIGPDGKPVCEEIEDPATGEMVKNCAPTMYSELVYSTEGPSLGEYYAVSAILNRTGAATYKNLLKGGGALVVNVDAEYYKAGDAFTATVTVDYDKLFESFHAYAAYHDGVCTDIQMEAFWKKEGLCVDKTADQCAIRIKYKDARGNDIDNVTIDPDNEVQQKEVLQAVERLRQKLEDEMLTPIVGKLGAVDNSKPRYGFKLDAKYEKQQQQKHATFEFKSPRGVNVGKTSFPMGIACVAVTTAGDVSRNITGDCQSYWAGSIGFEELVARQMAAAAANADSQPN